MRSRPARITVGASALLSTRARVPGALPPRFQTMTMREALTPAVSPAPAEAARAMTFSVELAVTRTSPPALTCAPSPIRALTSLLTTDTTMAKPIPAEPVVPASEPAMLRTSVPLAVALPSVAETVTLWPTPPTGRTWLTCAPVSMVALVLRFQTSTMTEPLMAALPVPAPPDAATEVTAGSGLNRSGTLNGKVITIGDRDDVDVTDVAPVASRWVAVARVLPESTRASVVRSLRMLTAMAAPTATPPREKAPATARFCSPNGAVALTVRSPTEDSVAPAPTLACVT